MKKMKIDDTDYNVVKIGNQYWLAENYKKSMNDELLTWDEAVEVAEKHDYLRLPTDADWQELKNWVKGKFPTQSERDVLCDNKFFCATLVGYKFSFQDKVMDAGKYAFFWSADDYGLKKQTHCWCLDDEEDVLYQATFPKTVKIATRYLVDSTKINDSKENKNV